VSAPAPAIQFGTTIGTMVQARLFQNLPTTGVEEIASETCEQQVRRGELILRVGEPADSVLMIKSGRVKITQLSRAGKEVILRVEGPGEVVGSPSPATGTLHTVSAQAITPCELLLWRAATFQKYAARFPVLEENVKTILAERLCALEERFFDLATQPVPQRLARLLVRFHERSSAQSVGDDVLLSCEELAQMTGTTLFTVSRLLAEWEERGIIQRKQRVIAIEQFDLLREVAERHEATLI
jgi:CRP-like cAMP-binding protein